MRNYSSIAAHGNSLVIKKLEAGNNIQQATLDSMQKATGVFAISHHPKVCTKTSGGSRTLVVVLRATAYHISPIKSNLRFALAGFFLSHNERIREKSYPIADIYRTSFPSIQLSYKRVYPSLEDLTVELQSTGPHPLVPWFPTRCMQSKISYSVKGSTVLLFPSIVV